ncbi:MAG: hypothetical protein VKJ46_00475 [Leptolyngbyaceae bacterium]|nr:hypothetical protein [Leptolyngbyaceae bacterium]
MLSHYRAPSRDAPAGRPFLDFPATQPEALLRNEQGRGMDYEGDRCLEDELADWEEF